MNCSTSSGKFFDGSIVGTGVALNISLPTGRPRQLLLSFSGLKGCQDAAGTKLL
jgi:hypothetical protein